MLDGSSPDIAVESSSNQQSANGSLSGEKPTSWSPSIEDKNPYIKYTVVTGDGSNAKYFKISMKVSAISSIHVYVVMDGHKVDTNFIVSIIFE